MEQMQIPRIMAQKPPLPTLWVDTAIGMKLAKVSKGELIQDIERRRVVQLKELIIKLTRGSRLLCPMGEQEFEYWGKRLDDEIADEFAAHLAAFACFRTKQYMIPKHS